MTWFRCYSSASEIDTHTYETIDAFDPDTPFGAVVTGAADPEKLLNWMEMQATELLGGPRGQHYISFAYLWGPMEDDGNMFTEVEAALLSQGGADPGEAMRARFKKVVEHVCDIMTTSKIKQRG